MAAKCVKNKRNEFEKALGLDMVWLATEMSKPQVGLMTEEKCEELRTPYLLSEAQKRRAIVNSLVRALEVDTDGQNLALFLRILEKKHQQYKKAISMLKGELHDGEVEQKSSSSSLHPDLQADLRYQLNENIRLIKRQYASYVRCIRLSLQSMGTTVEDLRAFILSLDAFQPSSDTNVKLFSDKEEKLEKATSIEDVFCLLTKECASFFNYEIFHSIIEEYDLDGSQEKLNYPIHLQQYINKHKLSEFYDINPKLEEVTDDSKELILKLDMELTRTTGTLKDRIEAIARVLKLKPSSLRLVKLEEGCVIVTLILPVLVAKIIFTSENCLSLKQKSDLQALSVMWLRCNSCFIKLQKFVDSTDGKSEAHATSKHSIINTYLSEWQSIQDSATIDEEREEVEDQGIYLNSDAIWLEKLGFGSYVAQLESSDSSEKYEDALLRNTGISQHHAHAIRRRMKALRSTVQRRRGTLEGTAKTAKDDQTSSVEGEGRAMEREGVERKGGGEKGRREGEGEGETPGQKELQLEATPTSGASNSEDFAALVKALSQLKLTTSPQQRSHAISAFPFELTGHGLHSHRPHSVMSVDSGVSSACSSQLGTPVMGRTGAHLRSFLSLGSWYGSDMSVFSLDQKFMDRDIRLHFENFSLRDSNDPDLPTLHLSPDALGITRICDLSERDMDMVKILALLELTVTFDDHGIPLRIKQPLRVKKYSDNSLRSVPLSVLLKNDQKRAPTMSIPLVFEKMISHLEENALDSDGILLMPGSAASVSHMLQEMEAHLYTGQFSFAGSDVNDVCSLLKQFIRELPVPLLTQEYLPAFASIADIQDLKEQVRTLNLLILLLPDVHQKVLQRLLMLFEKIVQHSSINQMDLTNVAMVIAPHLFMKLPSSKQSKMDDVAVATRTSHIVKLLINYQSLLWTIPGEMVRQIRYLHEKEVRRLNPKSVQKAMKQMHMEQTPSRKTAVPEVSHHIIRVKAPLFTRVCMAVDIHQGVTAGDVVAKLYKKSRLNQDAIRKRFSLSMSESPELDSSKSIGEAVGAEQFLFEAGGNIGERCLPHNTDMYALYTVNPHAQWIIKPRDCPDLN